MKKWIWIPVVLGLAVAARMISQGTDASVIAKARKELTSGCLRQGLSVKAMTGSQVEQFCACSVDRTIKLLGAKGLRKLESEATTQKEQVKKVAIECVKELAETKS